MQFGYPASVLTLHRTLGLWSLDHDFDPAIMSWKLVHGAAGTELQDAIGSTILTGQMTADIPLLLKKPGGGTIRLDRVEIDGTLCLFIPSEPLIPGTEYQEVTSTGTLGRAASPEEIAEICALGSGTMIATEEGPQPIDWLRPGDRVLTRDNGYQQLLWLGSHTMPRRAPAQTRPLVLEAGCFGAALPERSLIVSPGTGVLLAGQELELWFGESEMFAQARHAAPEAEASTGRQPLYSLLFAAPEVILAEGMWVAAVHSDAAYISLLPDRVRGALAPRLPEAHGMAARAWLVDWEVAMFRRERIAHARRIAA